MVGRYLMDTTSSGLIGHFPQLAKLPPHNDEGTGSVQMYIPWWKYDRGNDFLGGYHVELYGGRTMPLVGMFDGVCHHFEGYGSGLKRRCREMYGTFAALEARGEMIPNEHSYCEIDPDIVDEWGIPVLRFHFTWSENEIKMAKDMHDTLAEIIEAAGGTVLAEGDWWRAVVLSIAGATPVMPRAKSTVQGPYGYLNPGGVTHEVGTVRMGTDQKTSVLNGFCQTHDVRTSLSQTGRASRPTPKRIPR
jgi:choline dehydrogenase-like flavoprotein